MDGFVGGSGLPNAAETFGEKSTAGVGVFDASQYEFFGNDVVEEVELGGLEDEEEELPSVEVDDIYRVDQEEDVRLESLNDVDYLADDFSELNRIVSGLPRNAGFSNDGVSRESSSAAEWANKVDFSTLYDRHIYDFEDVSKRKNWFPQPAQLGSKPLHRTSSYSESHPQQQHQHFSTEPIPMPKSLFPSHPPPGGMPQHASPNSHLHHPVIPYIAGRPRMALSQSVSNFPGPPSGLPRNSHFGGDLSEFSSGNSINNHPPGQWLNQSNMFHGDHAIILKNMMQQQLPHQNGLMPQVINQQQQQQHRLPHPVHPHFNHIPGMHPQMHIPYLSASPPMMNKFEGMLGIPDMREQRSKSFQRNRQSPQHGFDNIYLRGESGWPKYRSKYMTAEEIENIIRMQLAATHSNDPYVDDYYYQACLAKKSAGARLKHDFCPNLLKELPPRARHSDEPHAFLQVEALGRIPFSSVRRPKPLLEIEPTTTSASGGEENPVEKSLEQEPLLAARLAIEECHCLLLDVDDIDRFLRFNELPDGSSELRQRRQSQLEGLASSFQLVDPLRKFEQKGGLASKDDLVFLQIVSLPKGQKLLLRFLKVLSPGDELLRIICMAIFRHLRTLFGTIPSDPIIAETTAGLVKVVSVRVHEMDLNALSACLAAVVCSSEQPPLRPVGSSAGDGASVLLKSVLERATDLLRNPHGASSNNMPNRTFWQASFDEFFFLLTKYCISKYDSIMQPLLTQASSNPAVTETDVARAIRKEMPMELLRASLPHTNEQQRKLLMDFAQRSVPNAGINRHG